MQHIKFMANSYVEAKTKRAVAEHQDAATTDSDVPAEPHGVLKDKFINDYQEWRFRHLFNQTARIA